MSSSAQPDRLAPERPSFAEVVRRPVCAEAPAGTDATYDDAFLAIKARIDALGTLSGRIDQEKALADATSIYDEAETPDFAAVVEAGTTLLADISKDFRVVCYVALGLYHRHGVDGLADGLEGLQALVDTHWDEAYPAGQRLRARSGAITFLMQRLADALDAAPTPQAADRAPLERARAAIEALQPVLTERMGEHAPVISPLKRRVEALLRQTPTPPAPPLDAPEDAASHLDAPPEDASGAETDRREGDSAETTAARDEAWRPAAPASANEPADGSPATNGSATTGGLAAVPPSPAALPDGASLADAERVVVRAAGVLRASDASDPRPYRLVRSIRWDPLRHAPPHTDARTQVPPPSPQRRAYLQGLLNAGQTETLIAHAEDAFQEPSFHFWLDLQHLLVRALEAEGEAYRSVRDAVVQGLARLLRRVENLPALCFADGTPFADAATRAWITSLAPGGPAGGDGEAPNASGAADALVAAEREARRILAREGLSSALACLQRATPHPSGQRAAFRRRLAMAELCLQSGRPDLARPLLETLAREADTQGLAAWEPKLLLGVWQRLYACYGRLLAKPTAAEPEAEPSASGRADSEREIKAAMDRTRKRICALDPVAALALD
jgi:type VI secretion system protein VasJ